MANLKHTHCTVPGCGKKHYANGLCVMHRNRFRRHGSVGEALPVRRLAGEGTVIKGYRVFQQADRTVKEHTLVAEKALGRRLPAGAVIHHVDENRLNNAPSNLVICPNQAYHTLVHQRMRALEACGHADWLKCKFCGLYDAKENLWVDPNRNRGYHRECANTHRKEKRFAAAASAALKEEQ